MSLNKKKFDCYENIRGLSVTGQKGAHFEQNFGVAQTLRQQMILWYLIKAQCMIHNFLRKTLPFTFMRQISQSDSFHEIFAYN